MVSLGHGTMGVHARQCTPCCHKMPGFAPVRRRIASVRQQVCAARWDDSKDQRPAFLQRKIASEELQRDIRIKVEESILRRGGKVTVGDVSAESGCDLNAAQKALTALASDSQATLKVSREGDIVYEFSSNFREVITGKSLLMRMEPVVEKIFAVLGYLGRVAFGTALISSLAIVTVALSVISSSSSNNDRDDRPRYHRGPSMWFSLSDMLWYWDPWYYQRYGRLRRPDEMGFLESIFSCVFGDGNPNEEFESNRWSELGRYIQSRGGVLTAEELVPFLDVTMDEMKSTIDENGIVVKESYVLPALTKFEGYPEVDAHGNIVYVFPTLQTSAAAIPSQMPYDAILEDEWKLTKASNSQKILVGLLGFLNLAGVAALSVALQNPRNLYVLAVNGLQGIVALMPWLQLYAISFVVIPLSRLLLMRGRNAAIRDRNAARTLAARSLSNPSASLSKKLRAKKDKAIFKSIKEGDVVYRSDRSILSKEQPVDRDADEWERKFQERQQNL